MSEDRSSRSGRNRLPRGKILRGKDSFSFIFNNGTKIAGTHIDLRYRVLNDTSRGCLTAFVAGKKLGSAVKRNYLKRILREAFRLHQHILEPVIESGSLSIEMIAVMKRADTSYQQVNDEMEQILNKLSISLSKFGKKQ